MYSFYFITKNEKIKEILNKNGYIEYPKTKDFVYQQLYSRKETICRKQDEKKFIDVGYLLDNLINPRTTNIIMHNEDDKIVGILNFYFLNGEIATQGLCVDQSEPKGAGTLLINYLKAIAIELEANQIKIFIVDNKIAGFYKKNGFQQISEFYVVYDINESNKITTTPISSTTGGKNKLSKLKRSNSKRQKTHKKKYKKTRKYKKIKKFQKIKI